MRVRYEKAASQEEAAYQQQRRRLYAEVEEEKERMAMLAQQQRADLDRRMKEMMVRGDVCTKYVATYIRTYICSYVTVFFSFLMYPRALNTYVCMCTSSCVCVPVCMYVYRLVCMCSNLRLCVPVCVYVFQFMHAYMFQSVYMLMLGVYHCLLCPGISFQIYNRM